MKYNHMLDVAFTIVTPVENWEDIPVDDLVKALQQRVDYLRNNPADAAEAFGFSDSYEVPCDKVNSDSNSG